MNDYYNLEREFIEKQLLKEIDDFKKVSRRNFKQISNNSRPNSNNRVYIREGFNIPREVLSNREAEKIIITKSGKKRIFRFV